jgi:hypothetical protein
MNIEARLCIHCCCVEAIIIIYSESVFVALCIQHAKSRSHIVIAGLFYFTVCFFTLPHKRHDFRNWIIENRMRILIFYTHFFWNVDHSKKNWARFNQQCILVFMLGTRHSCQILIKFEFSHKIFEKDSNVMSWKSVQWESSCSMRYDGRTDRHNKALKNDFLPQVWITELMKKKSMKNCNIFHVCFLLWASIVVTLPGCRKTYLRCS